MSISNEEYVREMEALFESVGWKIVEIDARQRVVELKETLAEDVRSWDEVVFIKGQLAVLAELINLPDHVASIKNASV